MISSPIWGLPVRNTHAPGDSRTISRSDLMSSRRCSGVHSSKASTHINSRGNDAMAFFSISTMSGSRRPWPPNSFLASRKASRVCSGIPPLLASCLSMAPNIFVADCSCCEWKSQYSPTTATSFTRARLRRLSITRELLFADRQPHLRYLAPESFLPDISFPHTWIPVTEQDWFNTTIFRIPPFSELASS